MSGTRRPDHAPPHPRRGVVAPLAGLGVAVMEPWTTRKLEIMRERCYLGADAVADAIREECGTVRSRRAIESQASRYHMSLRVRQVCPECGAVGVRLNRQSGLCPRCTELMHLEEEIAFNEILEREREELAGAGDVEEIRRERDAMRQRNSRLCRKYGLKSRRERGKDNHKN